MKRTRPGRSTPRPRGSLEPKGDARERILRAAEAVFGASGLAGARTRDIAARARTNISQLHYYFGSKEELYVAVLRSYLEEIAAALEREITEPGATFEERVRRMIGAHFDALARHPMFPRLMMDAVLRLPGVAREIATTTIRPIFERLFPELLRAAGTGECRLIDVGQAFISVLGMNVIYFVARPIVEQVFGNQAYSPEGLARRREAVVDLFLHGILERGGKS